MKEDEDRKILELYEPLIHTTPDEDMPFLLLKPESNLYRKFIMENYLGFYAYDILDPESDGCSIRFEHFLDMETFEDFESMHYPVDLLKSVADPGEILCDCLKKDYLLLVTYNKQHVDFFNETRPNEHKMILYGYDKPERIFYCKDYRQNRLNDFTISFEEATAAIQDYPWDRRLKTGLFGLKSKNIDSISLYQMCLKLGELINGAVIRMDTGVKAYGVEGIRLMRFAAAHYIDPFEKLRRNFELVNFLREYMKLWEKREHIVGMSKKTIDSGEQLRKLIDHTWYVISMNLLKKMHLEKSYCEVEQLLDSIEEKMQLYFYTVFKWLETENSRKECYHRYEKQIFQNWGRDLCES